MAQSEKPKRRHGDSGPGTPLKEVARKQLPAVTDWLRAEFPAGTILTHEDIANGAPGMKDRAPATRRAMAFCIQALLKEKSVIRREKRGSYRVVHAI